jgi:methylmalonyl-CoA mutase N-terminal domain/subunit
MYNKDFLHQLKKSLPAEDSTDKLRQAKFKTSSGIPLKDIYSPLDLSELDYKKHIGWPGQYPFTRHVHRSGYRGKLWTMRQYAGFGSASESNSRYKYLLSQGTTGLSVAFDLPTQIGLDPDNEMSLGEVGKVGVSICSLRDMRTLFADIPLEKVSISMTINAPAAILFSMYLALAKEKGIPWKNLNGTTQNDILKEYMARGTYIFPPTPSLRLATDLIAFCSKEVPQWNPISVSGYHIREAGCTAAQEIAFTLADGIAYVDAVLKSGLNIDDFASRISFFFNGHNQFFEEVAKFRAARRMWANIIKDRFGSNNPKSQMMRFHTQTAGSTLTAQQPDNNVVRTALQAFAAICGGTQSLHTNGRDEALALPSEKSAQIALRTQQILAYETKAADVVDPLAGSYLIEHLTDELEKLAYEIIAKIDDLGGMNIAIEKGYPQREIQNAAYQYQMSLQSNDEIIVGVNQFVNTQDSEGLELMKMDTKLSDQRSQEIAAYKKTRLMPPILEALKRINSAAQGHENLLPHIIAAVELEATVGEISDVLRDVFGEHQEKLIL